MALLGLERVLGPLALSQFGEPRGMVRRNDSQPGKSRRRVEWFEDPSHGGACVVRLRLGKPRRVSVVLSTCARTQVLTLTGAQGML